MYVYICVCVCVCLCVYIYIHTLGYIYIHAARIIYGNECDYSVHGFRKESLLVIRRQMSLLQQRYRK